jgi:hypothetical protein
MKRSSVINLVLSSLILVTTFVIIERRGNAKRLKRLEAKIEYNRESSVYIEAHIASFHPTPELAQAAREDLESRFFYDLSAR